MGTKDYQEKVIAFASDLLGHGIEVELDKWSLKEGNALLRLWSKVLRVPTLQMFL